MKHIRALLLLIILDSAYGKDNSLLHPQSLTKAEIEELAHNWTYTWSWHFANQGEVEFHYSHDKAGFIIKFFNQVPLQFRKKKYLKKKEYVQGKQITVFEYRFGTISETTDYEEYREMPNTHENTLAQRISVETLCDLIHDKKVVFYTGAGISAAADIQTLDTLEKSLGVDRKSFINFVWAVLKKPQQKAAAFKKFAHSLLKTKPTQAHCALTRIAQRTSAPIFTENIDLLHQKTGLNPICLLPSTMSEITTPDILKSIDLIICIGMNRDNVGFLEEYKKKNKKGAVVALDIQHAKYIGKGDFFVQGDAQEIVPEIEKKLFKIK